MRSRRWLARVFLFGVAVTLVTSSGHATGNDAAPAAGTAAAGGTPGTTPSSPPMRSAPPMPPAQPAQRPPMRRGFLHLNVGVPVFTTIGPWTNPNGGSIAASTITPDQRFVLVQLIGGGYWVHPNVRLTVSLQFAETLTSQPLANPVGASTLTGLTFMSAIAWAAFTFGPVFVGVGPMVGVRWLGNSALRWPYLDAGIFTAVGASLRLPAGFLLGLAVQMPITFQPAVNFSIVPAVFVAVRF